MGASIRALAQGDLVAKVEGPLRAMIPVYVINLARSPERRAFMSESLGRAGVDFAFVPAVDGRACRSRAPPRPRLSIAETALILSHRKAWRRLLRSDAAFAVVLEDDAHVGAEFAALLGADWSALDVDAVKLETMFDSVWLARRALPFAGRELRRLGAEHLGAAGYVLSREGARKALVMTRALNEPVDQTLFGAATLAANRLRVLQLLPAIVVQDNLHPDAAARREIASTLHDADRAQIAARARAAKPRGLARLAREAARLRSQIWRLATLSPTMRRMRAPWR